MNTQKLREALAEMKRERALLDAAITNVSSVLEELQRETEPPVRVARVAIGSSSYIDLSERVLEEAGKPMHVRDITQKVSELRGKEVPRASVESSLIRHIASFGGNARIVKVKPAVFGLPIWGTLFSKENNAA